MSYEKNTVGWWLSQLKEPLRSSAFAYQAEWWGGIHADSLALALRMAFRWEESSEGPTFWERACAIFAPDPVDETPLTNEQQSFQVEVVEIPPTSDFISTGLGIMEAHIPPFGGVVEANDAPCIPVVHDYSPPIATETSEVRHERQIKEQEARISALEGKNKDLWDRGDFLSAQIIDLQDKNFALEARVKELEFTVNKINDYITSERGYPL